MGRGSESLFSSAVCRLPPDWVVMRQQGSAPGIMCSAQSYHPPPRQGPCSCRRSRVLLHISTEEAGSCFIDALSCFIDALLFLNCSTLVSTFLPFPDQQLLKSAFWSSGKVKEAYFLQTSGGHRKDWYPGGSQRVLLHFTINEDVY